MARRLRLHLIVAIILCYQSLCFAAVEDFTTYTEVDSDSKLVVLSTTATLTLGNTRGQDYGARKDAGAGHFGDFTHLVTGIATNMSASPNIPRFGWELLSNVTGDMEDASVNTHGVSLMIRDGDYLIYVTDWSDDSEDFYDATNATSYYCTFSRSSTTLQALIYSDSGRTSLLDTISTTCETTTYQYLTVAASQNTAGTASVTSVVSDLDLQEAGGSSIKTVNGLAVASVKTKNGLAIASVKTINGLQ